MSIKLTDIISEQESNTPSTVLRASVVLFHEELKELESKGYKAVQALISADVANSEYGEGAYEYIKSNAYATPIEHASFKFPYKVKLVPTNAQKAPAASQLAKRIAEALAKYQMLIGSRNPKYDAPVARSWKKVLGLEQIWANVSDEQIAKFFAKIKSKKESDIWTTIKRMDRDNDPDLMGLISITRVMKKRKSIT